MNPEENSAYEGVKLLLTIEEAAHRLSLGRTTVYELVRTGELGSVRVGRARRIPVEALARLVAALEARDGVG